jgi:hypothetical protein
MNHVTQKSLPKRPPPKKARLDWQIIETNWKCAVCGWILTSFGNWRRDLSVHAWSHVYPPNNEDENGKNFLFGYFEKNPKISFW